MMLIPTNSVVILNGGQDRALVNAIAHQNDLLSAMLALWVLTLVVVIMLRILQASQHQTNVPIKVLEPNTLREREPYHRNYMRKAVASVSAFLVGKRKAR